MIKKILLTLLVILGAYLFLRWRQKKTAEVARNETVQTEPAKVGIYYLAGSLATDLTIGFAAWIYYTLN